MIFVVDTNIVSDLVSPRPNRIVEAHFEEALQRDTVCLSEAVIYEVERGWLHVGAEKKMAEFHSRLVPR